MGKHNLIEAVMGAVVLLVAVFFLIFAYSSSRFTVMEGYELKARFERADGIIPGSEVRLSGVKVGIVTDLSVDTQAYQAVVTFQVPSNLKLPQDTVAEILGDGLLGSKFIALVPGGDDESLSPGDVLEHTQSSVSLESLIGQLIFSSQDKEDEKAIKPREKKGVKIAPEGLQLH
ncbi:MAG: outer membrane lipid asymmetry maintenance protein MlaD [Alphaproteobacteria bacterium]